LQIPVQLLHQIILINKKLEDRRMKIALQDTVSAIHGAIGADVQNLIAAAGILPGTRARLDEGTLVGGEHDGLFRPGPGIGGVFNGLVEQGRVVYYFGVYSGIADELPGGGEIGDQTIDKQLGNGHDLAFGEGMGAGTISGALNEPCDHRNNEDDQNNQDTGQRKIGTVPGKAGDAGFFIFRHVPVAQDDGGDEYG
jgi:hypothetical protein